MSVLKAKFNTVEVQNKECRSLKLLTVNRKYPICELRRVSTKWGIQLLAELEEFVVFLPHRFSVAISDEDIQDFNQKVMKKVENFSLCLRGVVNGAADLEIL